MDRVQMVGVYGGGRQDGGYTGADQKMLLSSLREAKTCDLVSELAGREGVRESVIEAGEKRMIEVEGPARVFVVVD